MKVSPKKLGIIIWIGSMFAAGGFVQTGAYGLATVFALLAISLGVPLMRAYTENSK